MHRRSWARWLAAILGIWLPGMGHVFNRQFARWFFFHASDSWRVDIGQGPT